MLDTLKKYYVHYEYTCWKCPKRHEGTATIEAATADEAQAEFEKSLTEWNDWPGVDTWDYDTKVTGVSWRL